MLRSTMVRACALRDQLKNPALLTLVSGLHRLPSLPSIYEELVAVARDDASTIDQAARIIAKDAGLTAHLLHIVNSVFFSLRRTIVSPAHAVGLLGLETVTALVLSTKVHQTLQTAESDRATVETLQRHGLAVAQSARQIVSTEEVGRLALDQAFTAGLLHDVGWLVLAGNFPEEHRQVEQFVRFKKMSRLEAERTVFGSAHAEVGAYLLSIWGLNETIVESVAFHHIPIQASSSGFTVLTAIHVANAWVDSSSPGGTACEPDRAYLSQIGLTERSEQWKKLCQVS
jgi:putative nucleotidyltransferase with HDIG domain